MYRWTTWENLWKGKFCSFVWSQTISLLLQLDATTAFVVPYIQSIRVICSSYSRQEKNHCVSKIFRCLLSYCISPTFPNVSIHSEFVLISHFLWKDAKLLSITFAGEFRHDGSRGLVVLIWQTKVVRFSHLHLLSTFCHCRQSKRWLDRTSWDTSFPPVILSSH